MSKITDQLDCLYTQRLALAALTAEIEAAIPEDLRQRRDELTACVKAAEEDIKRRAEFIPDSQAHTLVGSHLQLVWQPETPVSYVRKAYWAIKSVGKK